MSTTKGSSRVTTSRSDSPPVCVCVCVCVDVAGLSEVVGLNVAAVGGGASVTVHGSSMGKTGYTGRGRGVCVREREREREREDRPLCVCVVCVCVCMQVRDASVGVLSLLNTWIPNVHGLGFKVSGWRGLAQEVRVLGFRL